VTTVDFLVVGAGIAGASIASELIRHGSVLILEAEDHPGYHTTGRSASMLHEFHGDAHMRALVRRSRPFLESPPDGFAVQPILGERGVLFIARSDQLNSLARIIEKIYQESARVIRGDNRLAMSKHPALRPESVAACLWNPDAMDIDVHALLHGFLRAFRQSGGELRTGERVVALRHDSGYWTVQSGETGYRANVVVNAAGAWADEVGRIAGAQKIGLVPKRRSVCILPAGRFDVSKWPMVGDVDEEFYFKPDAGSLLLSPSEETPIDPCDVYVDELEIARAVACLEAVTDIRVTQKITRQWAGLRSFVSDGMPVVGYDKNAPGFFWLAGQGGDGIQTSPALSRLACALATDEPVPDDLAADGLTDKTLSPERLNQVQNNG
jgi:D-arginine dehydrogenase